MHVPFPMESDYDMFDVDASSDYNSDDDGNIGCDDADDDLKQKESNYIVLTDSDIRRRIDDAIGELSSVLPLSKHEASTLLRHYNWNPTKVFDAWFADEPGVRTKVGLLKKPDGVINQSDDKNNDCGICFESFSPRSIKSADCGHPFCSECWRLYINTSVSNGPGCLMLRCPEPSCPVAVSEDMIKELASEEGNKKFHQFLLRSYIEDSKKRKWCPAADCECAIEFVGGDGNFNVSCKCSHSFCWICCEERHRPVACETVAEWMLKNRSDSQNDTWKKAYTKPCPKCNRAVEKNGGCMRMACPAPCNSLFCWICLQDWSVHGYGRPCNGYDGKDEVQETESLKTDLRKYQHYYERWAANEKSKQIALRDLEKVQKEVVEKIGRIQYQSEIQLGFLVEAWQQIVDCRCVLKWTYAYGFYLPEKELGKKQLFEYLQGQAESALERLHDCAESELNKFSKAARESSEFRDFRRKLLGLTSITKNYFENLVRALETGLSDVTSASTSTSQGSTSSHNISGREKRKYTIMKAEMPKPPGNLNRTNVVPVSEVPQVPWTCEFCSFKNPGTEVTCTLCHRGAWSCRYCTFGNPRSATSCEMCHENR